MFDVLAFAVAAAARRVMGWGDASRLLGKLIAMPPIAFLMWEHGPWPAILCAVLIPWVGWTIPWHGEAQAHPDVMAGRNGLFTFALAFVLYATWGIEAWAYALSGFLAGAFYGVFYALRRRLPIAGTYLDGWSAYAEHGLGACTTWPLALARATFP
jgi:hypothetical protein